MHQHAYYKKEKKDLFLVSDEVYLAEFVFWLVFSRSFLKQRSEPLPSSVFV